MIFIKTKVEFDALLKESKTKTVFIDFTADWCGPCKFIGPIFEELAGKHPGAKFVKVDVDEAEDVAQACNISAMPTFHVYKNGAKADVLMGADKTKLVALIEKHA